MYYDFEKIMIEQMNVVNLTESWNAIPDFTIKNI